MTDADPLLTTAQAAKLAGMNPGSWRTLVGRGTAPEPDDPGDPDAHPNRRTPRWRTSAVVRYRAGARYRGKASASEES